MGNTYYLINPILLEPYSPITAESADTKFNLLMLLRIITFNVSAIIPLQFDRTFYYLFDFDIFIPIIWLGFHIFLSHLSSVFKTSVMVCTKIYQTRSQILLMFLSYQQELRRWALNLHPGKLTYFSWVYLQGVFLSWHHYNKVIRCASKRY